MNHSETFDLSLQLYRMVGWPLLKVTVFPTFFCLAAVAFFADYVAPGYAWTEAGNAPSEQIVEAIVLTLLSVFVAAPLMIIGVSMISAIASRLVSDFMVGNVPDIKAATLSLKRTLPRLLWLGARETLIGSSGVLISAALFVLSGYLNMTTDTTSPMAGVIYGLGILAIFAAFIVFAIQACFHALVAPAAVLENLGAKAAARRSRQLMKAHGYHPSGYERIINLYLLLLFIAAILGAGFGSVFALFSPNEIIRNVGLGGAPGAILEQAIALLPLFLVLWTVIPVWAVTVTIIYYERRVRLEGYDIEALAAEVWRADRQNRFEL